MFLNRCAIAHRLLITCGHPKTNQCNEIYFKTDRQLYTEHKAQTKAIRRQYKCSINELI